MGKKDSKHSNSIDRALFRNAVADSKPVQATARYQLSADELPPSRSREPRQGFAEDDRLFPTDTSIGETLSFMRTYVSRRTMRELKRGKIHAGDEIDLHGLTSSEARTMLRDFIDESVHRNFRCVRVIHGKGLGSGSRGPILKALVNSYLQTRDEVTAFCSAQPSDGGTGAVYILLKTR